MLSAPRPLSPYDLAQLARAPKDGAQLAITLVPGTWAYGILRPHFAPASSPRWFEPGSAFRTHLESELTRMGFQFTLDVLQWDGANSVRRRAAQAEGLARKLTAAQRPGLRQVVIGHSHGGSIAWRAASLVSSPMEALSVVTLSTPFLQASSRNEDSPRFLVDLLIIMMVVFSLGAFYLRAGGTRHDLLPRFLAVVLLYAAFITYKIKSDDKIADLINTRVTSGPRLLVLRGFSDEASNSLVLGSVGAGLMNAVFYALAFPARWVIDGREWRIMAAILAYLGGIVLLVKEAPIIFHFIPVWKLVACLCSLATLPLLIAGFFALLYGRELFFESMNLLFTVDSVPDTDGTADVVTLSATQVSATGLRHGLYSHGGSAPKIAYWLATGRAAHYFNSTPYSVERPGDTITAPPPATSLR